MSQKKPFTLRKSIQSYWLVICCFLTGFTTSLLSSVGFANLPTPLSLTASNTSCPDKSYCQEVCEYQIPIAAKARNFSAKGTIDFQTIFKRYEDQITLTVLMETEAKKSFLGRSTVYLEETSHFDVQESGLLKLRGLDYAMHSSTKALVVGKNQRWSYRRVEFSEDLPQVAVGAVIEYKKQDLSSLWTQFYNTFPLAQSKRGQGWQSQFYESEPNIGDRVALETDAPLYGYLSVPFYFLRFAHGSSKIKTQPSPSLSLLVNRTPFDKREKATQGHTFNTVLDQQYQDGQLSYEGPIALDQLESNQKPAQFVVDEKTKEFQFLSLDLTRNNNEVQFNGQQSFAPGTTCRKN